MQSDAEAISCLIKERITPLPQFNLKPFVEDNKNLLAIEVSSGRSTPYYYKADGVVEAYVRVGNEIHIDMFDDRLEIASPGGKDAEVV